MPRNIQFFFPESDSRKTAGSKQHKAGSRGSPGRPELRKDGWIVDCVTWNPKWESPPLDADPHDFLWDESTLNGGEPLQQRQKIFDEIYRKRHWDSKDPFYHGFQASGPGAMLKNAQSVIASLHVIIAKAKAYLGKSSLTILDVACGDLQWMSKFLITRDDIEYVGVDIVPDLMRNVKEQFGSLPKAKLAIHDIVATPLNQSYDLVICRDLLQFLWQADAMRALNHISSSGSKFLLATTFPDTTQNEAQNEKDFSVDRKFPYNLELPPFLLEPPICTNYDYNVEHLGLWELPIKQKYEY